jgi:nucleotide-binding universal stress UspA family protein
MGNERTLIQRILFATDFSTCARHAEQYVTFLANVYGAAVHVVHVLEIYGEMYVPAILLEQRQRESAEQLTEVARRLTLPAGAVTHRPIAGIPSVLICEAAMGDNADLIVLGTRGRTGLEHILLGSTAERVLTMAPCPVLTVREMNGSEGATPTMPMNFERVMVPIDFSDCSLDALEYGVQIVKALSARLTLLHVLEPVAYGMDFMLAHATERDQKFAKEQMQTLASRIRTYGISVTETIRGGLPADSIVDLARGSNCGLIIMGTHGRRGVSHLLKGSVAEAVLRRASCPVLAVKNFKFPPGYQPVGPAP